MSTKSHITTWILIAMILGAAVGYACYIAFPDPKVAKEVAGYISLITDVFLRLIKMIIAPLVFSTLVIGIDHYADDVDDPLAVFIEGLHQHVPDGDVALECDHER